MRQLYLLIMLLGFNMSLSWDAIALGFNRWVTVNDTVMGGRSSSKLNWDDGYLVFSGFLSLENNGGFASTRALLKPDAMKDTSKITVYLVGDGREYQLRLRTNRGFDGLAYSANFPTIAGKLLKLEFKPQQFTAGFRGYAVLDAPELSFVDVRQLGFMLADKNEGEFQLKISSINFEN